MKRSIRFAAVPGLVCAMLMMLPACGGGEETTATPVAPKLVTLTVGDQDNPMSVTFRFDPGQISRDDSGIHLPGSVSDFSLPFNKVGKKLTRAWIGGDPVINEILVVDDDGTDGVTPLVMRYSAPGTGGGEGNLGTSIVLAFNLDKELFDFDSSDPLDDPQNGSLTASEGKLSGIYEIIAADLELLGAKSSVYTQLAGMGPGDAMYNGFVVFDPTNPESIGNAYFEFASSQSRRPWTLVQIPEPQ